MSSLTCYFLFAKFLAEDGFDSWTQSLLDWALDFFAKVFYQINAFCNNPNYLVEKLGGQGFIDDFSKVVRGSAEVVAVIIFLIYLCRIFEQHELRTTIGTAIRPFIRLAVTHGAIYSSVAIALILINAFSFTTGKLEGFSKISSFDIATVGMNTTVDFRDYTSEIKTFGYFSMDTDAEREAYLKANPDKELVSYDNVGFSVVDKDASTKTEKIPLREAMGKVIEAQGIFSSIAGFVVALIASLVILGSVLSILIHIGTVGLKLVIMVSFSPIPMAFFASDTTQHYALSYVKKLLSVGIQFAVIYLCALMAYTFATHLIPMDQIVLGGTSGSSAISLVIRYAARCALIAVMVSAGVKFSDRVSADVLGG